jgi:Ser/Thr protein kinase RdoA (MazF antagonist)
MASDPETPTAETDENYSEILDAGWDVAGPLARLGSLQDRVFRLDTDSEPSAVLKFSTGDRVDETALLAEAELLQHLKRAWPSLRLPLLLPGSDGKLLQRRGTVVARMMQWVGGLALARASHWTTSSIYALGDVSGRISKSLSGFDHPGLRHYVEWDPRHAIEVVQGYLPDVAGPQGESLAEALGVLRATMPAADCPDLPEQPVHLDLTDHNVLGQFDPDGRFHPLGAIDFGDLVRTWRICELAVSVHAAIGRNPTDPLAALTPVVEGFRAHQQLEATEIEHLWTLIVARAAICVAAESVEAARSSDDNYVGSILELDIAALRGVLAVNSALAHAVIRTSCGLSAYPVDLAAALCDADPVPVVAPESVIPGAGWLEPTDVTDDAADSIAPDALRLGALFAVTEAAPVRAPLEARVIAVSESALTLACQLGVTPVYVRLEGLATTVGADDLVARGQVIGAVRQAQRGEQRQLYVQIGVDAATPPRGKVRDRMVWAALCPDPGILIGRPSPPPQPDTLQQRQRHVAAAQRTYYRELLKLCGHTVSGCMRTPAAATSTW